MSVTETVCDPTPIASLPSKPIKTQKQPATRLRGVPVGLLCRSCDIRDEMKISFETWQLWRRAGLETHIIGTDAEFVLTDAVHAFVLSKPTLEKRVSRKKVRL